MTSVVLSPGRWTLRARLIASVVALLAVACLVVGGVVTLALRGFLLDRLDQQVQAVTARAFGGYDGDDHGVRSGAQDELPPAAQIGFLNAPGLPFGTVGAHVKDGVVTFAGTLRPDARQPVPLPASTYSAFDGLSTAGVVTRTIPGLGEYRLTAHQAPDGDLIVAGLPVRGVDETLGRLVLVELVVAGSGLVIAGVVGSVIVRRTLTPLERVATTATRVSSLPLDRGEVELAERVPASDADPRTEVGQVGLAINRMLGHVGAALAARQASETRVRQFVADASHELRTPLASIRGYAEYAQLSGRGALPDDVAHALSRVRSQTERMSELVDDLLLLARLDEGRPLAAEPVDLSRLVVDAVGDARAAGPDHAWRLDLPPDPVEIVGDESRLHQVVGNLLANARTHTSPGTTVTVRLGVRATGAPAAVLTVADDGPGIPPTLLPDVFDRFARGESSRVRDSAGTPSTGLGLAIVAAVAEAHGGSVAVRSRPGATVFEVTLPLAADAAPSASAEGVTAGAQKGPMGGTRLGRTVVT